MKLIMAKRKKKNNILVVLLFIVLIAIYYNFQTEIKGFLNQYLFPQKSYSMEEIPVYDGQAFVIINNNEPNFNEDLYDDADFENYSKLDILDRCGVALAKIGKELMPTEERGSIGMIKPSGWHTVKYDNVEGKYLYNRCHLIGYQLTGENANPQNLITCTRQMNTGVMLEYENKVADYIKTTNNHVLYRVTPIFEDNNLVASGVQMEGYSIEDKGEGIKFNIYVYNVQDGIEIDYKTGESKIVAKK